MVTFKEFAETEVNSYVRSIIVDRIKSGLESGKVEDELIFNRFSIKFSFLEDQVVVFDDIFPEEEPLLMSINELLSNLSENKKQINNDF